MKYVPYANLYLFAEAQVGARYARSRKSRKELKSAAARHAQQMTKSFVPAARIDAELDWCTLSLSAPPELPPISSNLESFCRRRYLRSRAVLDLLVLSHAGLSPSLEHLISEVAADYQSIGSDVYRLHDEEINAYIYYFWNWHEGFGDADGRDAYAETWLSLADELPVLREERRLSEVRAELGVTRDFDVAQWLKSATQQLATSCSVVLRKLLRLLRDADIRQDARAIRELGEFAKKALEVAHRLMQSMQGDNDIADLVDQLTRVVDDDVEIERDWHFYRADDMTVDDIHEANRRLDEKAWSKVFEGVEILDPNNLPEGVSLDGILPSNDDDLID